MRARQIWARKFGALVKFGAVKSGLVKTRLVKVRLGKVRTRKVRYEAKTVIGATGTI